MPQLHPRLKWALPRLVGVAILAWVLHRVGPGAFLDTFGQVGPLWFFVVLGLNVPHLWCKIERWHRMLLDQGIVLGRRRAAAAYLAGIALGAFTPGRAGEFFRAWFPVRQVGAPLAASLATVMADRLYDLALLLAVSALAAFWLTGAHWALVGAGALAAGLGALFLLRRPLRRLLSRVRLKLGLSDDQKDLFVGTLSSCVRRWPAPLAWTIAGHLFMNLQVWVLAMAVGAEITLFESFLLFSVANTVALLPVSILGLGTREAVLGALFVIAGHSEIHGVTVALGFFLLGSIPVTLAGGLLLLFPGRFQQN
ncbi:MAG: hypothetical protein CVU65_03465 [Deltaproteobacteria bacterium HGW-Deltaproteobacteria-22]|jgi:uncharacterized membrane protein YbhN (UPF0104 family)|nr:MAG: hypothetical protein CVU65_03465 [Deltaproteobacteria bacterium HGW-Deltaproteobacteria-22]